MTKTVFVGNIAYDVSEEQLIDIFSQVGRVLQFRLVLDRDSGRSRGYGFCEYEDLETAASAVRNLNGYEINGRCMRVDFSENDTVKSSSSQPASTFNQDPTTAGMSQLPVASQSATDAITAIIGSLTANQLFEIMSQMKALVQTSPEQARAVLLQAPQISYALFQALIIMKVITPATIQQVLHSAVQPQPQNFYGQVGQKGNPAAQPTFTQQYGIAASAPTVNRAAAPPAVMDLNSLPADQRAAIMQIMHLSDAQIEALPPVQRQQVLLLKQQLGGNMTI